MRPHAFRLLIVACLVTSNGCLAKQFKRDGQSQQDAVSQIYTDQAMNNLIRARCNMPFVQLKYDTITVNDQDHFTATGGINQVFTTFRDILVGGGNNTLANTYNLGGTADRQRIMSFNSEPITDQNDIYDRYLAFANDPGLFCVSDHVPKCPVHIQRAYGKKHYWVPAEAGPAFLDLVMKTAIMRGEETMPPGYYEVKVVALSRITKNDKDMDQRTALLEFDPKIPNGNATLVFTMSNGRRIRAQLKKWTPTKDEVENDKAEKIGDRALTPKLRISWNVRKDVFDPAEDLPPGLKVRIYSHEYPPEVTAPDPTVRQIGINVTAIKNQVQLNNNRLR
jgi:hypothetical protein